MTSSAKARTGSLARYHRKRDFAVTPEPRGHRTRGGDRFVVQRHAARTLHYDFRLEVGGVLRSWAVPKGPSLNPAERRLAVATEDHPVEYGEFEGVIPERQYGAGKVTVWDRGSWSSDDPDPDAALTRGKLNFHLRGEKLSGGWSLIRMGRTRGANRRQNWLLIKARDRAARTDRAAEITRTAPAAPRRRRTRASRKIDAPRSVLPRFVAPQLATLTDQIPAAGAWCYEIKYDGYRILARIANGDVRLYTRNRQDWTARLPHLARAIRKLRLDDSWLDGEIAMPDPERGMASFQALQNAFDGTSDAKIVYYVFDAPYLKGHDLRQLPLVERKERLGDALRAHPSDQVRFSDHLDRGVEEALDEACRRGLEGLIAKRSDAPYVSTRTRTWLKLKCRPRQEFVIGGYTDPAGSRHGFGALLVGLHDEGGRLRYVGRVGAGFTEQTLRTLARRFASLARDDSPFVDSPRARGVHWLKPALVAELEFAGWTNDARLRQAAFIGLREDKPARAVRPEAATRPDDGGKKRRSRRRPEPAAGDARIAGVTITHPDRAIWPDRGITKVDLARYYERVSDWLMPHLAGRPLSMLRCPDGSDAECFFQRHLAGDAPAGVETFVGERSSAQKRGYHYVTTLPAVIAMVQRGVVEFHTWGATVPHVSKPDRITLDLDPGPDVPWEAIVAAAQRAHELLDELGLKSFLKTTGGKGLHVVLPLSGRHAWDDVRAFARGIAEHLARASPKQFTATMAKRARTGRIFVDYLRNAEGASAVAAYCARARPGAPVSMPLGWDELSVDVRVSEFTVQTVPDRLTGRADPWRDYAATRQVLMKAARRMLRID
jgi:bifunctional non-homologous end joining protein LigD